MSQNGRLVPFCTYHKISSATFAAIDQISHIHLYRLALKQIIATLFFTLAGFCLTPTLQAQPYTSSLGLRVGSVNGVSWQQFWGRSHTGMELMLAYHRGGLRSIGLITQHISLGRRSDSYLYFGVGGHAGVDGWLRSEDHPVPTYGLDAMLGFSYVFPFTPIAVSLDVKPAYELHGRPTFSGNQVGASVRFWFD